MGFAAIAAGSAANRSGLETFKTALSTARDAKELLRSGDWKDQVGQALEEVMRKLEEGEAAMAGALGHRLCRCQFPPTPMLRVGYPPYNQLSGGDLRVAAAHRCEAGSDLAGAGVVHACPKCKRTNAPERPNCAQDRMVDASLPFLTAPPVQSKQPAPSGFEGWGW